MVVDQTEKTGRVSRPLQRQVPGVTQDSTVKAAQHADKSS